MARPLRIEYSDAWYHVMNRGNGGQEIFLTDEDRFSFIKALKESSALYGTRVIALVLMTNHFHLIVQTMNANLSEFMRQFLVTYTVRFNRRWHRAGHVFQGRFKSLFIECDDYKVPLSRYIHLNPLRAKDIKDKNEKAQKTDFLRYPWSTLPGYWIPGKRLDGVDYRWFLQTFFGGDTPRGRTRYWQYVCEGISGEIENPFDRVVHQSILGGENFVKRVKGKITQRAEREIPSLRTICTCIPVEAVLEQIGRASNTDVKALLERRRETKVLRQMAMDLCYRYTFLNQRQIGDLFGVDYSTVSQNRARLKAKLREDTRLRRSFEEMEGNITGLSK